MKDRFTLYIEKETVYEIPTFSAGEPFTKIEKNYDFIDLVEDEWK